MGNIDLPGSMEVNLCMPFMGVLEEFQVLSKLGSG